MATWERIALWVWDIPEYCVVSLGPVSLTFFQSQFKFDGSFVSLSPVIARKFCTWHDSCAVVACAKICCDLVASNGIMARLSFHRIWIADKNPLVKRSPDLVELVLNRLNERAIRDCMFAKIWCQLWHAYIRLWRNWCHRQNNLWIWHKLLRRLWFCGQI